MCIIIPNIIPVITITQIHINNRAALELLRFEFRVQTPTTHPPSGGSFYARGGNLQNRYCLIRGTPEKHIKTQTVDSLHCFFIQLFSLSAKPLK